MPRWLWFAPLAVLVLVAGLLAFRQGMIAATLSETQVIELYSARYVSEAGGAARPSDCSARPDPRPEVWLVVRCHAPEGGAQAVFPVDRLGRLLRLAPPPERADAPRT